MTLTLTWFDLQFVKYIFLFFNLYKITLSLKTEKYQILEFENSCVAIYAIETEENSSIDTSNNQDQISISESGDVSDVVDYITPTHDINDNLLTVYV